PHAPPDAQIADQHSQGGTEVVDINSHKLAGVAAIMIVGVDTKVIAISQGRPRSRWHRQGRYSESVHFVPDRVAVAIPVADNDWKFRRHSLDGRQAKCLLNIVGN